MSDFTVISDTNPLYAEIDRLKRERDELQSAFEDAVTRAEKAEGERDALADALQTAIITLERDGDEWNMCDTLRAALAQVRK